MPNGSPITMAAGMMPPTLPVYEGWWNQGTPDIVAKLRPQNRFVPTRPGPRRRH